MNSILLSPKIESDKSVPEQLQQMKSYLFQFKEQMELLLMNIDSDNVSEKFKDDFSKIVGSRIMNGKEMSEIIQTAGMIKMSVKDVSKTVSSLSVTVGGIYAEVHGQNGILSRLSVAENGISASVKKGIQYSGISLSAAGVQIDSSGNFTINTSNFTLNGSGDLWCRNGKFSGYVDATSGKIGDLLIDNGWLSYKPGNTKYPVISHDALSQMIIFGSNSFSTRLYGFDLDILCGSNYIDLSGDISIHSPNGIRLLDETKYNDSQYNYTMHWQKLSDVDPDDYVICNIAG